MLIPRTFTDIAAARDLAFSLTRSANYTDEALAYRTEAICLLRAASQRSIDVDEEFPELRPIPVP